MEHHGVVIEDLRGAVLDHVLVFAARCAEHAEDTARGEGVAVTHR